MDRDYGVMTDFLLYHRHSSAECPAAFAAWNGFDSPLRGSSTYSTCAFGGHEIWWFVTAEAMRDAVAHVPDYIADRTVAVRVGTVDVP
jgi:hypothetical protein